MLDEQYIKDLCDEPVANLRDHELNELRSRLDSALERLDEVIDELDSLILARQREGADHSDLDAKQEPLLGLKSDVEAAVEGVRARLEDELWAVIDGEIVDVDTVHNGNDGCPDMIEDGRRDWYVAADAEDAGEKARRYWESLADNDPKEFTCLVGEETLIQWGLGRRAGPGSTQVSSLQEWLDLWLDTPEEQWAGYDGSACDVDFASAALIDELGYTPTVAYRHN